MRELGDGKKRRVKGAGNSGMAVQLSKKIVIRGTLTHDFNDSPLPKYTLRVYGNLEIDGKSYPRSEIFQMSVYEPIGAEEAQVYVDYPFEPVKLKAIKHFRELLSRYMQKLRGCQELSEFFRDCVRVYLEELDGYSDGNSMLDQIESILPTLDLQNPYNVECLRMALFALTDQIACEVKMEVVD